MKQLMAAIIICLSIPICLGIAMSVYQYIITTSICEVVKPEYLTKECLKK